MKKVLLFLLASAALNACVHSDESNQENAKMSMSLATAPACDTLYKQVEYDSTWYFYIDSCFPKKQRFSWRKMAWVDSKDTSCIPVLRTGHKPAFKTVIDTIICKVIESPVTQWGCKFQDVTKEQELQLLKDLGCTVFRPNGVALENYTAASKFNFDYFYNNGIKLVVNIGWQNAQAGVIRSFATDLKLYDQKLRAFLDANGKYIFIGVIENEETNDGYFGTGHVDEYIAELRLATEIFHEYGIPVTDGATHLEYFDILRNNGGKVPTSGKPNQLENLKEVVKLHEAFKTMPYLTFVNFHTSANGPGYPDGFLTNNVAYLEAATGKVAISNEVALKLTDAATIQKIVAQTKAAQVPVFVFWSGDGGTGNSDADALTTGTTLTTLGIAYRDAIKK